MDDQRVKNMLEVPYEEYLEQQLTNIYEQVYNELKEEAKQ